MAAPVLRSVRRFAVGSGLPAYLARSGLGSNVSTWEGPPFMNRWITRLAFAGKCGDFGASGLINRSAVAAGAPSAPSVPSSPVSPSIANPIPERESSSRRVSNVSSSFGRWLDILVIPPGVGATRTPRADRAGHRHSSRALELLLDRQASYQ